jgi:hypothetical protein
MAFSGAEKFSKGKDDTEKEPLITEFEMMINGKKQEIVLTADTNSFQLNYGKLGEQINVPAKFETQEFAKQSLQDMFNSGELHEFFNQYSEDGDVFAPVSEQKQTETKQAEKTTDIEDSWPEDLSFISLPEIEYVKQTIKDAINSGKNSEDWLNETEIHGYKLKVVYSPNLLNELKKLFDAEAKKLQKSQNPRLSFKKAEDYFQKAIENDANYGWKEIVDINSDWPEQLVNALFQYGQTNRKNPKFLSLPQTLSIGEKTYVGWTPKNHNRIFILYGDYNNSGENLNYNWAGAAQFEIANKTTEEIISELSEWLKGEVDYYDPQI